MTSPSPSPVPPPRPAPFQPLPYPIDALQVMAAMRLGWALSELRGRLRPGSKLITVTPQSGRLRAEHSLPLGGERSAMEQLIEVKAVVSSLAAQLDVDLDMKELSGAQPDGESEKDWDDLALSLYRWDAKIQDRLAGNTFTVSSAYQLGRGLGDITWLDPGETEPDVATSWTFVLGELRVATLKRLAFRLQEYFQPHAGSAVGYSLEVWQRAASDPAIRDEPSTRAALIAQTKRWRDLLLTGLDPATLLPRNRILARLRQMRTVLHAYWPEILVAFVFALLIALGVAYLVTYGKSWLATFSSVFGAIGLTTSALLAKAKDEAQDLVGHLRATLDADLLKSAVTVSPFPEPPWWKFW